MIQKILEGSNVKKVLMDSLEESREYTKKLRKTMSIVEEHLQSLLYYDLRDTIKNVESALDPELDDTSKIFIENIKEHKESVAKLQKNIRLFEKYLDQLES